MSSSESASTCRTQRTLPTQPPHVVLYVLRGHRTLSARMHVIIHVFRVHRTLACCTWDRMRATEVCFEGEMNVARYTCVQRNRALSVPGSEHTHPCAQPRSARHCARDNVWRRWLTCAGESSASNRTLVQFVLRVAVNVFDFALQTAQCTRVFPGNAHGSTRVCIGLTATKTLIMIWQSILVPGNPASVLHI